MSTRTAVLAAALCLGLAGCGSNTDDVAGAASSASAAASAPASAAPSSAATASPAPSASSGVSAAPTECPLTPEVVAPPAGASTDLSKKPVIKGSKKPAPDVVQVADIVKGTGEEAVTLSGVEVKYVGALYKTGKEFDSSWKTSADQTLPFTACAQGTIPGFAIAPLGMKVGGRRQVTIPSQYGYGEQGSPPTIAGGADLVFVIDLVEVTPPTS